MSRYTLEWHFRPGRTLAPGEASRLLEELREVGRLCLDPLPDYQVFARTKDVLDDKALVVARRKDGAMAGFCAAVLIDVPGLGEVLHLGLLCIHPDDRGGRLTHALGSRLAWRYFLRRRLRRFWVTNVACVLSSLGNFALHMSDVHPAPGSKPGPEALLIAEAFDRDHRHKAYVQPGATFDPETFVFRGSGRGTAFQKRGDDQRYFHRDPSLNAFYKGLLHFDQGDELLQVGSLGLGTFLRYAVRPG